MTRARRCSLAIAIGVLCAAQWACAHKSTKESQKEKEGKRLEALLRPTAAKNPILVSSRDGEFGTTVVQARIDGAYPGTGAASVVLDKDGKSYGVHGERDIAELVRRRGFLKKPPEAEPLVRLLNDANYEGQLMYDAERPHSAAVEDGALVLKFSRRTFPSQAIEDITARFKQTGKVEIETKAVEAPAAAAAPGDLISQATAALDGKRYSEMDALIPRLKSSTDARVRPLLARATTTGNDTLAADALAALGATPEAAQALKDAWKPLDASKRAALVQLATELNGAAFGALLK